MIALRSTPDLKAVFNKLIKTMNAHVEWNGLFVVLDNFLILKGEERSLVFNFDTRRAGTNILELSVKEGDMQEIGENPILVNTLNMLLYAFGKWGTLKGVRVEKNYEQLNKLFKGILKEISVDPDYNEEHFYFYRKGLRIAYEDVISAAVKAAKADFRNESEAGQGTEVHAGGLWHSMVWQPERLKFTLTGTTLAERRKGRLGNNFYLVGYLCPQCGEKIYMAVFPEGKEAVIDTKEGKVRLARACTCPGCHIFYTPRPDRLIAEGDVYVLDFEGDAAAYEDYQELLGKNGSREANCNYNEYVDRKREPRSVRKRPDLNGIEKFDGIERDPYEDPCKEERFSEPGSRAGDDGLEDERDFETEKKEDDRLLELIEEGFYPDEKVAVLEKKIKERRKRQKKGEKERKKGNGKKPEAGPEKSEALQREDGAAVEAYKSEEYNRTSMKESRPLSKGKPDRLKTELEKEKGLPPEKEQERSGKLHEKEREENLKRLKTKAEKMTGKSYAALEQFMEEIESADIPKEEKRELTSRIGEQKRLQGAKEAAQLIEKMPKNQNRKGYDSYLSKLHSYKEADLSQYEEQLGEQKRRTERSEAEELVKRARKSTRKDLTDLEKQIREQEFSPEVTGEYAGRVRAAVEKIDRQRLDGAFGHFNEMSGEELERLYRDIEREDFLPELKNDALERVGKRLAKIKTEECELLIGKLKKELSEAGVSACERHYFYPARRVLSREAKPEETELINYAKGTYASDAGPFEYPVFTVDTSRRGSGREGMILTPEKLYYSNFITCNSFPVYDIKRIEAGTGLFNKGILVYLEDGSKCRVPYAVDSKELKEYAQALWSFVSYLKERPFSRKEKYLIQEKHDTICCFRCGYVYKGADVCPKCGYKQNK